MKSMSKTNKPKSIINITASILLVLVLAASLTGATYAWFIYEDSAPRNDFAAGTVILSDPEVNTVSIIKVGGTTNHAFVPNSGEASVSKVDLNTNQEIARYYTAPRLNDSVDLEGNATAEPNRIGPNSWRTSRITQDKAGNVWVLNVGADGTNLKGSVVRIRADVAGLDNTHSFFDPDDPDSTPPPFLFGTDDAVQVFPVGDPGDMPRAIAIDADGFVWVGFYSGGQLIKYQYDAAAKSLTPVGDPYYPIPDQDEANNYIRYYEMKFAPDGKLFISSRNSNPTKTPRQTGIWRFDPKDGTFMRETTFNAYSILIGGTATDYRVYATEYNQVINYRETGGTWLSSGSITPSGSQNRGMAFDSDGVIWVASTTGSEGAFSGNNIGWWDPYEISVNDRGHITLQTGNVPVGLGIDPTGTMWAVCRTDNPDNNGGYIEAFDPEIKSGVNTLGRNVQVGYRPYAYGDFSIVDNTCKTVEWEFENIGTKKVYVRAKPTATLNGEPVEIITLCDTETSWFKGNDGWYYLGNNQDPSNNQDPTIVPVPDPSDDSKNKVTICFRYCFEADTESDLVLELEVQAVQYSNNAIDHEWVQWENNQIVQSHPWY